jgi:hypothetical protein
MFKVNGQSAKIDSRHAIFGLDVESVAFAFTQAENTLLPKNIKAETARSVIKRLSGKDKKQFHLIRLSYRM